MTEASQKLQDLVRRFCDGDDEAFAQIVSDFNRLVISIAVEWNIPDEDLEDIAQEAWIRFYGSVCRESLNVKSFLNYLYRIVINLCRDYHKRKRALISLDEEGLQTENMIPAQDFNVVVVAEEVMEEIERLPERERQAVILKDKIGCSNEEIGRIMNETVANVKVLIHRGRSRIRKIFNRQKT